MQFVRYAIALALGNGSLHKSMGVAGERWPGMQHIPEMLRKAAIDPATTDGGNWAQPLSVFQTTADEYIEALRPLTILGKLSGVTPAPTRTLIPRIVVGGGSSWVGQNQSIPVSRLSLDTLSMPPMKVATIIPLSVELLSDSRPSAELLIRRDMLAACASYADKQFIDPSVTATASNPASITSGITPIASTGSTVTQINSDVQKLFAVGIAAGHGFGNAYWIMHPRSALYLSGVLTAGNVPMWPTINIRGGIWYGLPVIVSASVPVDTGDDSYIFLIDASEVLFADGATRIDVATHASLQLDSTPSNLGANQISLWQKSLAALKIVRDINYTRRRDSGVAVLSGVSF